MTKINDVLIYFSNRCNLDCSYCFTSKENEQILTWRQLKEFLIWFLNQPGDFKRIGVAGGEPFLEFDMIKRMINFLKKNENYDFKNILFSDILTNGTILNKKIFDFLEKEQLGLNFSLDGNFSSNLNRKFKNGNSCFDQVWNNLERYKKEIGQPLISVTIAPNNADKFYSSIKWLIDNGFYRIKFTPTVVFGQWSLKDVNIFIKEFRKIIKYYFLLKKSKNYNQLDFLDNLARKIKKQGFFDCGIGKQTVLFFNGNIYACPLAYSFNQEFKDLLLLGKSSENINLEKIKHLTNFSFLNTYGFTKPYKHAYIKEMGQMICLLFKKPGIFANERYVKNLIKLFLQIYKEIDQAFCR